MGFQCSRICNLLCSKEMNDLRVGLFGLKNSGKTTILYQLKLGYNINPAPTIGFNVETLCFQDLSVNIWEIGGSYQEKTCTLWKHYNRNINAIIFVVDAADIESLPEAMHTLQWIRWQPRLSKAHFLIYANKQDIPGALSPEQLTELLEQNKILLSRKWVLQPCIALTGLGVEEGIYKLFKLCEICIKRENSQTILII